MYNKKVEDIHLRYESFSHTNLTLFKVTSNFQTKSRPSQQHRFQRNVFKQWRFARVWYQKVISSPPRDEWILPRISSSYGVLKIPKARINLGPDYGHSKTPPLFLSERPCRSFRWRPVKAAHFQRHGGALPESEKNLICNITREQIFANYS